jgi:hypothetical protein
MLDFDPTWSGGGTKFSRTDGGILVERNWVHDNLGHGLWLDIDVYNATVRSNLVERNARRGIFYEISHGPHPVRGGHPARIYWNEVRDNGWGLTHEVQGGGIYISNSEDVEVYENFVHGNLGGILIRQARHRTPHVRNVVVRDNDVSYDRGWTGIVTHGYRQADVQRYPQEAGIQFFDNTFRVNGPEPFMWLGPTGDADLWGGAGNDRDAVLVDAEPGGGLPDGAEAFAPVAFGARD